jgi:ABC-type multidrug transport system fused ATPase/permease subunit
MTLSQTEKLRLLEFTKDHYVDFYDVRLLIAKDLEDDILQQMKEDKTLSFEEALQNAFEKYGVIGFSDVSEDYMKKINTYFYKKVILKVVKDEVSKPKFWFLATACFLIIYYAIMSLDSMPFVLAGGFIVLIILGLIFYFRKLHKNSKELKKRDHYYYLDQLLVSNNSILFPFTYMPLVLAPHIGRLSETQGLSMAILAFFTMVSCIAFYFIYFRLYKNRSEILDEYKENFLNKKLELKFEIV